MNISRVVPGTPYKVAPDGTVSFDVKRTASFEQPAKLNKAEPRRCTSRGCDGCTMCK